jgi:hypothetical protein
MSYDSRIRTFPIGNTFLRGEDNVDVNDYLEAMEKKGWEYYHMMAVTDLTDPKLYVVVRRPRQALSVPDVPTTPQSTSERQNT